MVVADGAGAPTRGEAPISTPPGVGGSAINAQRRAAELATIDREPYDLLVVGGGVVGAGAALDAATRGLSVLLVEAQDWASGTSSRSTKLIHGGLRYLQMFDFFLVHEALKERGLLLEVIAPHLVTKMPFLYPLRHRVYERAYTFVGISLYDALARSTRHARGVPRQRQLSRRHMYRSNPGLRPGAFTGGIEYYDAQVDDARFVVALVRTGVALGVTALSRVVATGFERDGDRVVGASLRDLETGATSVVRARSTILASGVWTEEMESLAGREHSLRVRPSKGVHLVVPKDRIALSSAVVMQTEKSVLFIIPWGAHWIIGTTDTPWDHEKVAPVANATDISYLLEHVNSVLAKPLVSTDVEAVFAGLRPLIAGEGEETTKLSREHAVGHPNPGLVAISGGKYTTYRVMAKDAVDAAIAEWPSAVRASATESTPLIGASGISAFRNQVAHLSARFSLTRPQIEHLIARYGTILDEVLAPAGRDPSLLLPLVGAPTYLRAEVRYAVTHEGALHVEDVLRRRLRLSLEQRDRGIASLDDVARIMGSVLEWDDRRIEVEIERYRHFIAMELEAERQVDDVDASRVMESVAEPIIEPSAFL